MKVILILISVLSLMFLSSCKGGDDNLTDGTLDTLITINSTNQQGIFTTVNVFIDGVFKETLNYPTPQARIVYNDTFTGTAADFRTQRVTQFRFTTLAAQDVPMSCDYTYTLTSGNETIISQSGNKAGNISNNSVLEVYVDVSAYFE